MNILRFVLLFASVAGALSAHDFWLEPGTFSPQPGQILGVRLRVGQDFVGDPVPRDPSLLEQFVFDDAAGRKPLVGRDGADPAGFLRVERSGLLVIGYSSAPSTVDMPAGKFNQYLKDEGLDAIVALRARRNQTNAPAHELFSRCAKSLALAGQSSGEAGDHSLGFTLELVAERNPYGLHAGQDLPVRLTYHNRPLAGGLVVAMNKQNPEARLTARTDAQGRVHFRLPQSGVWLIKAVHMIPAPAGAGADWASYWASLTFDLPNAVAARN
jgi:uncharacterized GH25 family protein